MQNVSDLHGLGALIESGHKGNSGVKRDCRSAPLEGGTFPRLATRENQHDFAVL